jgi:hypothetical protein
MTHRQISSTEWEWQDGARTCGVRIIPQTQTLIWSAYAMVGETPVFEPGHKQPIAEFIQRGGGPYPMPEEVGRALRAALQPPKEPRRSWLRFRR